MSDDSCCSSPQLNFKIPRADGEPLTSDTRIAMALPEGEISVEGIAEIRSYLRVESDRAQTERTAVGLFELSRNLDYLGTEWQTRTGNYPKRLSRQAYQDYAIKITPEIMSRIGSIASEHSKTVNFIIEVTRKLNLSAEHFYHEESCWWGSYSESRCALKTNGGFALRTFKSSGTMPVGRAWVMPLRISLSGRHHLTPTFSTMGSDAFVVFNGYGDLSGYTGARIMASLAGWTYKKIDFAVSPMYINSDGYLVAPETTAASVSSLCLDVPRHSSLFTAETSETAESEKRDEDGQN